MPTASRGGFCQAWSPPSPSAGQESSSDRGMNDPRLGRDGSMSQNENVLSGFIGRTFHDSRPWWPQEPTAPAGAPNIVFIVLDDVGFADLGCYGSEIATPHMNELAAGGVRYSNFHVTSMCSPTRACLLTGRNA